ncbi:uncharacterized protein PAF06_007036 [Gastrophryne carolinensis]
MADQSGTSSHQEAGPSTSKRTPPANSAPKALARKQQAANGAPTLEPWMRQTVVLQLKEDAEGKIPSVTTEVFCDTMLRDQGFSKAETYSVQPFFQGLFYVTFISMNIVKRYLQAMTSAGPNSNFTKYTVFSHVQREERRVTVAMRNPFTPAADIVTFLNRHCTVTSPPTKILNGSGYWTGTWSVMCKLRATAEGVSHLPQFFALGSSPGRLHYSDIPQTCRKCGKTGHVGKDCREIVCKFCPDAKGGHSTEGCARKFACNLCGKSDHVYRNCPERTSSYAAAVASGRNKRKEVPVTPERENTGKKAMTTTPIMAKQTEENDTDDPPTTLEINEYPESSEEEDEEETLKVLRTPRSQKAVKAPPDGIDMAAISIFTINVRSIGSASRRNRVLAFLASQQAEIFMLQECSLPFSKHYRHLCAQWTHGPSYWSGGGENRNVGVAILIRGNRFTVDSVQELVCGRLLLVDGSWAGEPIRLINVYAPVEKNERMEFFHTLRPYLATTRAVVLAGDFNCPLEQDGRSTNSSAKLDKTSKLLREMVNEASLKDAAGAKGTGSANYTWSRSDGSVCSRIDFVFTSRAVRQKSSSLVPCFFSDHRAVYFQGELGNGFPPGPGSWKLNCTLLENEKLMGELKEEYVLWREQQRYFNSFGEWWEYVKVKFRSFFQAKSRQQVSERKEELKRLQQKLQCLQDLHLKGWNVKQNLDETKKCLEGHFEEEARRIVFRSKVENIEKGEKCNSFFFRKLHSGHTPLTELRDETGTIRKGKNGVMQVVSDYYANLYSPKATDDEVAEKFLAELFAECIRQNPEIRGITAPGPGRQEVKCSLYMDDVTVFCADQRSISALVQTCEDFGRASGAKVNCGKSEAMLFGKWQLSSPVPFNVKPDYIKILGVWFGKEGAALKSWDERIAKMNQKFGLWSLRKLSIEGKALVLRSEILPVLQYLAQAWPPRAKTRKTIAKAVFYFIWGSKMDRVKRTKLCKEPRKGGKGVPDIPTMLMVAFASTCVQRTARNSEPASAGHAMSRFFLLRVWRKFGWAKWDSSVPYAWNLPWFYKDVEDFILEQQLAGVKADLWKPKTVYRLIRAKDETEPILGLPLDTCRFVWKNVSSRRLSNQHKDLAWQAIQGGLPIRTFMHDRGLSRYRHCPLCVVCEETSRHLFWDCSYAQALLDALGSELKDCGVPRNAVTHCGVLYGLFHGNFSEEEVERAWRLMNCFKDAIWCARNRFILRREWMKIEDCRRLIHSLLRDYSLMDFGVEDEEDD